MEVAFYTDTNLGKIKMSVGISVNSFWKELYRVPWEKKKIALSRRSLAFLKLKSDSKRIATAVSHLNGHI